MTPREYGSLIKGYSLSEVDRQNSQHLQAWLHQSVQATDSKGRSKFKEYKDFFDYEKAVRQVEESFKEKRVDKHMVERFRNSVAEAERLLNGGR